MQLSNFKLNTRKRGSIDNEHSTDEGLSPETSKHFLDFGTFSNILNLYFSLVILTFQYLRITSSNLFETSEYVYFILNDHIGLR